MFMEFIVILCLIILLIEAYVIYALIKLIRKFLTEIHSIKGIQFGTILVGDPAPKFRGIDHQNRKIVLKDLLEVYDVTLLFLSSTCSLCKDVLNNIESVSELSSNYTIVVTKDPMTIPHSMNLPENLSILELPNLFSSYKITSTPFVYTINQSGNVTLSAEVLSTKHLKKLILIDQAS